MKKTKPFFAKFLENQIPGKEMADTRAGCHIDPTISMTLKAPSDQEDEINASNASLNDVVDAFFEPTAQTMKYPSDCEDQ